MTGWLMIGGGKTADCILCCSKDRGSVRSLGRDAVGMGRPTGRELCWAVVLGLTLRRLLRELLRHQE